MNLSTHFTLEELLVTQHRGVDNTPPAAVFDNLKIVAQALERARLILEDEPIIITSGYRSPELNALVGGSKNSAHMLGWAVDWICPSFGSPQACARRLDSAGLNFDQLIFEQTWVHTSFDPRMRREVLTAHFAPGVAPRYTPGIAAG